MAAMWAIGSYIKAVLFADVLRDHRARDALMRFLDRTGRFTDSLGTLVVPPPPEPAGVLRYIEGPILPIARGDGRRAA
jgi:hypothetical protein